MVYSKKRASIWSGGKGLVGRGSLRRLRSEERTGKRLVEEQRLSREGSLGNGKKEGLRREGKTRSGEAEKTWLDGMGLGKAPARRMAGPWSQKGEFGFIETKGKQVGSIMHR